MIQKLSKISRSHLSSLDEQVFVDKFNRRPFKIGHNFSDNPLFDLANLIEVANQLPAPSVEYNAGDLPVTQDPHSTPLNGLSVADTIERIETCNSWMVLKNVEQCPRLAELLRQCLAEVQEYSAAVSSGMKLQQGFIVISSPGSPTPFHIDPDNNFLFQIRGTKTAWMFGQNDRVVVTETQVEEFLAGATRSLEFKEQFRDRGQRFELAAGEGLHLPFVAPCYVENGPDVSISFGITFQTKDSADRHSLHRLNRRLRQLGITPSEVSKSSRRDAAKLRVLNMIRSAKYVIDKTEVGSW